MHDPVDDCWFLGSLSDRDGREVPASHFTAGRVLPEPGPLRLSVRALGRARDLSYAAFDLPVARRSVAAQLSAVVGQDIQRIPVQVAGSTDDFDILNLTARVAALDEALTVGQRHATGEGWLYIVTPGIDDRRTGGHMVFRLAEFLPIIVVTESVKSAIEQREWSGFAFRELPTRSANVA
jgi:hypothetical protein